MLLAFCRHEPSALAHTVAVFGSRGTPVRRVGWRVARAWIETDATLAAELAAYGVVLAPVPRTVRTIPPP